MRNALEVFWRTVFNATLVVYDSNAFSDLIAYAVGLIVESWDYSLELFHRPGGIFAIIFTVTCVGTAVFSYPGFHKRCSLILLILSFYAPTFFTFFGVCGQER